MKTLSTLALLTAGLAGTSASAQALINEFEPNPAGSDPAQTTFELKGTPGASFSGSILSIENDGINGRVDRSSAVSGTFDTNGLLVVTVPDLENPSFTVVLSQNAVTIGTDLDADDDGAIDDASVFGTVYDAIGVSDDAGDDPTLYASGLGGTDVLFNGEFEPLNLFRDGVTNSIYQTVTVDFGGPNEHLGIFAAAGGPELNAADFSTDPLSPTFGGVNPTIPEPASLALLGLGGLAVLGRRRG